jgi:hypothetical protein
MISAVLKQKGDSGSLPPTDPEIFILLRDGVY